MSRLFVSSLIVIVLSLCVQAETHITGDITGMTFESGGNPYIVEQDILIPAGNKAVIKNGCVFLFKPFTGLTVHGHLVVDGTQEAPVIFSSINDGDFNTTSEQLPNPFDWNGVLISRESGTVTFKNFALRFSVYGIKSQNTNIVIENGLFRQNGQFHFTINDKIQFVQDNIPYSYDGAGDFDGKSPVNKPAGTSNNGKQKPSTKRLVVRYGSLGIGGICTIGSIVYGLECKKNVSNITAIDIRSELPEIKKSEDLLKPLRIQRDVEKNNFNTNQTIAIATGVLAALGYIGFGLTFVF